MTPEEKERLVRRRDWIRSEDGRWFWDTLNGWAAQYDGDAARVNPTTSKLTGAPEPFEYFRFSKDIASGRSAMCKDILALISDELGQ